MRQSIPLTKCAARSWAWVHNYSWGMWSRFSVIVAFSSNHNYDFTWKSWLLLDLGHTNCEYDSVKAGKMLLNLKYFNAGVSVQKHIKIFIVSFRIKVCVKIAHCYSTLQVMFLKVRSRYAQLPTFPYIGTNLNICVMNCYVWKSCL